MGAQLDEYKLPDIKTLIAMDIRQLTKLRMVILELEDTISYIIRDKQRQLWKKNRRREKDSGHK